MNTGFDRIKSETSFHKGGKMPCSERKHTPIRSKKQRGLFGAELSRRRRGKKSRMKGISVTELESHLRESKGKKLPRQVRGY